VLQDQWCWSLYKLTLAALNVYQEPVTPNRVCAVSIPSGVRLGLISVGLNADTTLNFILVKNTTDGGIRGGIEIMRLSLQ
jgi:hypothetical protein